MKNLVFTTTLLAFVPGCYDACVGGQISEGGTLISCEGMSDEAGGFSEACGQVMFVNGMTITSHNACSTVVGNIIGELGAVPFSYAIGDCGTIPADEQWDCFSELELLDNQYSAPVRCGYCPNYTDGSAPRLCWAHPNDWAPGVLSGQVTQEWCDEVDPPLGSVDGLPLPMSCAAGISCLRGETGCGCKCRNSLGLDVGSQYYDDYISSWWNPTPVLESLPPEIEGVGLPVEATCSGEPLSWAGGGSPGASWLGTTIELDGFEPAYPPNGENHHTPLWELTPKDPFNVEQDFALQASKFPMELFFGSHAELVIVDRKFGLRFDACETESLCHKLGFRVGSTITGLTIDDRTLTVQAHEAPFEVRIEVSQ